jgi:hypothetical protein
LPGSVRSRARSRRSRPPSSSLLGIGCVRCTHVCNLASLRSHRSNPKRVSAHRWAGQPGIRSPC